MAVSFVLALWALPFAVVCALQAVDAWLEARWEWQELERHRAMQDALRGHSDGSAGVDG